jgi:predicted enzyme related to lactoylglutathione lyase
LDGELTRQPSPTINDTFELVVIGIKNLKEFYETVFGRAIKEVKA